MFDNSYERASAEFEAREPKEDSQAVRDYQGASTEVQVAICKEFLDHVDGWELYQDWAWCLSKPGQDRGKFDRIREYCEKLPSFWDFLDLEG